MFLMVGQCLGGEVVKLSIDNEHTRYAVFFLLDNDMTLTIGKLGTHHFLKGRYIYVVSAKKKFWLELIAIFRWKKYLAGILTICARMEQLRSSKALGMKLPSVS